MNGGYVRWLTGHTESIGPLDKYRMSVYTGNRVRITRMLGVTSRWKVGGSELLLISYA